MWDGNGGHPLMVAVSCQYRSIRGSVVTSSPAISSSRSTGCIPGAGSRMRFSTWAASAESGGHPRSTAATAFSCTQSRKSGSPSLASTCLPMSITCRIRCRKPGSLTSSASSTQASTCSGEGSSGRFQAAPQRGARAALTPPNTSARKSSIICLRSATDILASLFIKVISSLPAARLTTTASTARCSRSARICASSASRWTAATSAILTWPSSTRRTSGRPSPSSRSVTTSSSRAAHAASYSRRPPPVRAAGGSTPASDQNRMVRTGSRARLASSPIDSNGPPSSTPPVCFLHPLEKQPRAAPHPAAAEHPGPVPWKRAAGHRRTGSHTSPVPAQPPR